MKQTLPFIFLAVLQAASLVQAQGAPPTPPPAPAPAAPAMEGKLDSIIGKIEYNERLDTKLDGIITRLDSGDRVSNKLDTILSAIKEHDQKLEKLATTPATPAAAAAPAAATVATPAATVAPAAPAPPASGDVSLIQLNVNDVWIVLTAAMVFFMQAGFVMLEIGACRAKNTINIVMKSFLDFCICAIVFLLIGFAFMFGKSWNGVIGTDSFWLSSFPGDHRVWVFWFFQVGFAGVSCTIMSGAVAERTKFLGYLMYCALFTALIYPVIGHWAWGSFGNAFGVGDGTKGWLEAMGFVDYAGSSVVHACGGSCALAGILAVGPRAGRFGPDGSPRLIAGHNIPLVTLGVFLLWFGWFGFNAGSSLSGASMIGRLVVNTTISPSAAGIAAMVSMWFIQGKPDVNIAMNGALGGAVAITACCGNVTPGAAIIIGAFGGIITTVATIALERWKIDDAVGAVPVHLACGWWGTLCVALFDENGFSIQRFGVQALGTLSISVYSFVVCTAVFAFIKLCVRIRATEEEQINGLDFTEHAANAYPDFQTTEQA
jgi:Amt family ammonium transporter